MATEEIHLVLTICGRCVKFLAYVLRPAERVDLGQPLGAARFHELAQLPQRDAILRRPPLHRRHGAGPAAAARTTPDNPLALKQYHTRRLDLSMAKVDVQFILESKKNPYPMRFLSSY